MKATNNHAGTIYADDNDSWSESTEDVSKRAKLKCPHSKCGHNQMPLMHKNIKLVAEYEPWVGVDYKDYCQVYETHCSKCKKLYSFTIRFGG